MSSNQEHTLATRRVLCATVRIVPWESERRSNVDNMAGLMQPVGPEPPVVYWVRRGALLLVVVTLVLGGWWLRAVCRVSCPFFYFFSSGSPHRESTFPDPGPGLPLYFIYSTPTPRGTSRV